jgi:hypothetical protein
VRVTGERAVRSPRELDPVRLAQIAEATHGRGTGVETGPRP